MLAVPEIFDANDVGLGAVPLFHVFGLNVALGLTLATGAALVLEERFDPAGSLELVRDLEVTTLLGVPTMFAAWAGPYPTQSPPRSGGYAGRSQVQRHCLPRSPSVSSDVSVSRYGRAMG